jgi:hypothetical protein
MSVKKVAALNIGLFAFFSLNPYFKWLIPSTFFYSFFIISTITITHLYALKIKSEIKLRKGKLAVIAILLIFMTYFTLPIVHEMRWGHFLWFIPFILILFYQDDIVHSGYLVLKNIMVWFAIFSLVFWVLNFINLPIPYYSYYPDFRHNSLDYYRVYGFSISLYRGSYAVGEMFGIERLTGVFAEPGHFGIYLGYILAIERFNLNERKNKILLTSGILTFSTAFLGILFLGLVYRLFKEKRISRTIFYPFILFLVISIIGYLIAGVNIKNLILGDFFNNQNTITNPIGIVDSRVSNNFLSDFQFFGKTSTIFTGFGYAGTDLATTNWRGLVFRFGIIGISIIIMLIITIIRKLPFTYFLLLIAVSLLVLSHRSYLFYTPGFYILLYFASIMYYKNN